MMEKIDDATAEFHVYEMKSTQAVIKERAQQIHKHGYDSDHDDEHVCWELHDAATAIMMHNAGHLERYAENELWPWQSSDGLNMFHNILKKEPYEILAVVAALILADMDRLERC